MTDTLSVPGWITIPFGKTSELKALGRNGYMQCHGVSVSIFGSDIHLEPIHSKGDIGRARVPVPFTAVRELRDALDTLMRHRRAAVALAPDPLAAPPTATALLEDPGGGPEILMSGSLFDGRTFKVTRYAWVHLPDKTRYDMFIDGVMVAVNCTEDRIINSLVVQLAWSAGA